MTPMPFPPRAAQTIATTLLGLFVLALPAAGRSNERSPIESRVRALMAAYGANDPAALLALVDPHELTVYGSDVSETVHDTAGLKQMLSDDFRLWGTAKFGDIQNLDIRQGGDLATAFFHVPFSAGGQPPVIVRVTTVWRKIDGKWLLTQSANTVPTVGSSARALLQKAAAPH